MKRLLKVTSNGTGNGRLGLAYDLTIGAAARDDDQKAAAPLCAEAAGRVLANIADIVAAVDAKFDASPAAQQVAAIKQSQAELAAKIAEAKAAEVAALADASEAITAGKSPLRAMQRAASAKDELEKLQGFGTQLADHLKEVSDGLRRERARDLLGELEKLRGEAEANADALDAKVRGLLLAIAPEASAVAVAREKIGWHYQKAFSAANGETSGGDDEADAA